MLDFLSSLLLVIVAYLLGSVPYGLLLTKYFSGEDIRTIGSGNIGATNVLRTGKKKLAAATLACDMLKGFIPVCLAKGIGADWTVALTGLAAVLGHVFPVWLKFKGGRGGATALAVFTAAAFPLAFVAAFVWGSVFYITRFSSLAAVATMIAVPVVAFFFVSGPISLMIFVVGGIVVGRHKENIIRLLQGKEMGFGEGK